MAIKLSEKIPAWWAVVAGVVALVFTTGFRVAEIESRVRVNEDRITEMQSQRRETSEAIKTMSEAINIIKADVAEIKGELKNRK